MSTIIHSNPWIFDDDQLAQTPSIKAGMTENQELSCRIEGARFIQELGSINLNLHHNTTATASVYFHRFYMYHSFNSFQIYPMATACLFLAGKAEETPKKSNDLLKCCRKILSESDFATFQESGVEPKDELLALEKILLQTLKFDLEVEHPYENLLEFAKQLHLENDHFPDANNSFLQRELIQKAWTFLNDSYCTNICLQYEPEVIAISMLFLARKVGKFRIVNWDDRQNHHKNWWDAHAENLDAYMLNQIGHKMLDMYSYVKEKQKLKSPTVA